MLYCGILCFDKCPRPSEYSMHAETLHTVHSTHILQKTSVLWQYAISNIAIEWQRTSIASERESVFKIYCSEFIGCRKMLHSVKVLTAFKSLQSYVLSSPMWLSMDRGGVCEWPFWGWHTGWLLSVPLGYGHLARPGDLEDNWAFSRRCELSLLGLHLLHESYSDFMSLSVLFFPTDMHLLSILHRYLSLTEFVFIKCCLTV